MESLDLNGVEAIMLYLEVREQYESPEDLVKATKQDALYEKYSLNHSEEDLLLCAQLVVDEVKSWYV